MLPVEIIKKKRNKKSLTKQEIKFFVEGFLSCEITDYQMSAFLMAVHINGMNDIETFDLTEIMLNSGKVVDLSYINKVKVDKHSTGGVGDKTSLILAPLVASCGIAVPMISGRALGHTGGTLDKLESIPGFNVNYSIDDYKKIIEKTGVVMIGQNDDFAPADKRIYALRDVTGTVDNISLITASIMSKKLAEGADALVFDIKFGCGANLQDYEESRKLTKHLISVSKKFGKKAIAILTDMEEPLGYKIGNWLEVEECLEVMNGKKIYDLNKVNNVLSGAMIYLGGKASSIDEGEKIAEQKLQDGSAYKKFLEITQIQNGDVNYINDWKNSKRAKYSKEILSKENGYINEMNAFIFGLASIELGCGRKKADDKIDYLAGIILNKKCGDKISKGEVICELWAEDESKISDAEKILEDAVVIENSKPEERKLIIDIID
ncbi:MAG: thymidine phosphorylase [Ignavibacteria bacterium]|jgi:pyrimidine-nucleoside phosphorylase